MMLCKYPKVKKIKEVCGLWKSVSAKSQKYENSLAWRKAKLLFWNTLIPQAKVACLVFPLKLILSTSWKWKIFPSKLPKMWAILHNGSFILPDPKNLTCKYLNNLMILFIFVVFMCVVGHPLKLFILGWIFTFLLRF